MVPGSCRTDSPYCRDFAYLLAQPAPAAFYLYLERQRNMYLNLVLVFEGGSETLGFYSTI